MKAMCLRSASTVTAKIVSRVRDAFFLGMTWQGTWKIK